LRRGGLAVLRDHRDFRFLYLARTVSLLGDWFNLLALLTLLRQVQGSSAESVGWVLILKLLPVFLLGPVAGVVADRFSRRHVMILTDVLRCLVVCALFAAAARPGASVWLVYGVTFLQHSLSTFFEPARTASVPNLVPERDLPAASALGALTWSVMFTLGASLGGVVTAFLGWQVAIAVDALTYLASAVLVFMVRLPRRPPRPATHLDFWTLSGLRDVAEGARYIAARPRVASVMLVKSGWGIAGAITLVLTVYGQRVYPVAGRPELGVALLWFCRALGTGVGPILARRIARDEPRRMRWTMVGAYLLAAAAYLVFASTDNLAVAALTVVVAHFGGSTLWVFSTVLLQRGVDDAYRGRVFAAELGLATLLFSVSNYVYGQALDMPGVVLPTVVVVLALSLLLPASLWAGAQRLFRDEGRSGSEISVQQVDDQA
jgi:MFS family permease